MHPLLKPMFPIRLASAAGALWCVGIAGALLGHAIQNNAPLPAAASPPEAFTVLARSDRLAPLLAFDDRWQAPARAMPDARIADAAPDAQERSDRISRHQERSHRAKRHADRVCGAKGRRYFHHGRRLSWRCRR